MNKLTQVALGSALSLVVASSFAAQPTRGFLIEQGATAADKSASIDLGVDGDYTMGALRLGVDFGEVILTAEKTDNLGYTEGLVKIALPALEGLSELKHSWAAYGGASVANVKYDSGANSASHVNLIAGLAFTAQIEALELNINPELVVNTNNNKASKPTRHNDKSDTYINLNFGAYYNITDTKYGSFKPGAEVLISSQSGAKTGLALGARWEFNERVNLDVLPFYVNEPGSNDDVFSLPGQLRLNASF